MFGFVCPVCSEPLRTDGRTLRCGKNHCYDMAKSGYVNLLMSNAPGAKRHGDDALMINARRRFLEKGYYLPLRDKMCEMLMPYASQDMAILDAGCGDGWYDEGIAEALAENGIEPQMLGIDISRDALKAAAKRPVDMGLAAASVFHLPVGKSSADVVLSVFSPLAEEEFSRVLRSDGLLMRVVPLEDHLWELKQAVYDIPRKNPPDTETVAGFRLIGSENVIYTAELGSNEEVLDLFAMTPYYYKSGQKDQEKLRRVESLRVTAAFGIRLWQNCKNGK